MIKKFFIIIFLLIFIFLNLYNKSFAVLPSQYIVSIKILNENKKEYNVYFVTENNQKIIREKRKNGDTEEYIYGYSPNNKTEEKVKKIIIEEKYERKEILVETQEYFEYNHEVEKFECEYDLDTKNYKNTTLKTKKEYEKKQIKEEKEKYIKEFYLFDIIIIGCIISIYLYDLIKNKEKMKVFINVTICFIITFINYITYPEIRVLPIVLITFLLLYNIKKYKGKINYIQILLIILLNYNYLLFDNFEGIK